MSSRFLEALRERLTLRNLVTWMVIFGGLYVLLDGTREQFVSSVISTVIVGLTDVAGDAYDLRESVQHGGIGLSALVGGAAMLALGADDPGVPAVFLAFGTWFVLDAIQTARHEGATKEKTERSGHEVYRDYLVRRVHETVKERPLTRRELHDELDADDESIDEAVEELLNRGVLERAGSELRVATPGAKTTASKLSRLGRRIARPVLLELGNDRSEDTDRPDGSSRNETSGQISRDGESERIDAKN